jgi:periplasmic copper chaperone A
MRKNFVVAVLGIALSIVPLLVFAKGAHAQPQIHISEAVAGQSHTEGARTGAVYFAIGNHGDAADALIGLSSDVAEAAELHVTKNENNIVSMRPVPRLDLFPGDMLDLRKLNMHVMLVGLRGPLKAGQVIKVTLRFEKAAQMIVDVVVGDQPVHAEHGPETEHEVEDTGQ